MFRRDFDTILDDMFRTMNTQEAVITRTPTVDTREYDGHRVEIVNGERTEYVLDDGEWTAVDELGSVEEETLDFELSQLDDEYEMTVDLTSQLPNVAATADANASLNNGILNLTFEMETPAAEESDE